jgi:hypothetical protein
MHRRGQYGQDIFSLRAIYLQGRTPASVNMHWRRFAVSSIPKPPKEFEAWVLQRWREKDALVEHYMQHGRFPADEGAPEEVFKEEVNGAGVGTMVKRKLWIETEVKPASPLEVLQCYMPSLALALIVHLLRRFWGWLLVALAIRSHS